MPAYETTLFSPPAPLAQVVLRDPQSGRIAPDVPMLIDSGADVTLLPEAALKEMAAQIEPEGYEVMAFDGSTSVSRVVRMDLLFLRRTFKGRFLIIDQPWGVLGRNVINHVCLMLNGPRLIWDEYAGS
jgi:hypothetical protein